RWLRMPGMAQVSCQSSGSGSPYPGPDHPPTCFYSFQGRFRTSLWCGSQKQSKAKQNKKSNLRIAYILEENRVPASSVETYLPRSFNVKEKAEMTPDNRFKATVSSTINMIAESSNLSSTP
uniref:Uncharacterized protein n=1 Tax=Sus scrofa TaxID=9823 RepID=A0A8D0ZKV7_PIG